MLNLGRTALDLARAALMGLALIWPGTAAAAIEDLADLHDLYAKAAAAGADCESIGCRQENCEDVNRLAVLLASLEAELKGLQPWIDEPRKLAYAAFKQQVAANAFTEARLARIESNLLVQEGIIKMAKATLALQSAHSFIAEFEADPWNFLDRLSSDNPSREERLRAAREVLDTLDDVREIFSHFSQAAGGPSAEILPDAVNKGLDGNSLNLDTFAALSKLHANIGDNEGWMAVSQVVGKIAIYFAEVEKAKSEIEAAILGRDAAAEREAVAKIFAEYGRLATLQGVIKAELGPLAEARENLARCKCGAGITATPSPPSRVGYDAAIAYYVPRIDALQRQLASIRNGLVHLGRSLIASEPRPTIFTEPRPARYQAGQQVEFVWSVHACHPDARFVIIPNEVAPDKIVSTALAVIRRELAGTPMSPPTRNPMPSAWSQGAGR